MDRRTSCHGIVGAMHTRRALKKLRSKFCMLLKLTNDRHEAYARPLCDSRATCILISTKLMKLRCFCAELDSSTVFAARCYASAANAVMRYPSVYLSVTFVPSVKKNKRIFKFFSPSVSQTILFFSFQMAWQYYDGDPPPKWGVECRWSRQKSRFWTILVPSRAVNAWSG